MIISSHAKKYSVEVTDAGFITRLMEKSYKLVIIDKKVYDLYRNTLLAGLKKRFFF